MGGFLPILTGLPSAPEPTEIEYPVMYSTFPVGTVVEQITWFAVVVVVVRLPVK
jgi:hypothetical protein